MSEDLSARYYKKKQRSTSNKACERHQDLSEEEKSKKEYGRERYTYLPEHEKQSLLEYRKKIL